MASSRQFAVLPITKEESILRIKRLIENYNKIREDKDKLKTYNEEMTKQRFIDPLFEALGWDIENKNLSDEVFFEAKVTQKRVDYVFKINGIQKFALEAKSLREQNIDDPEFAKQSIEYAWYKMCTWAVLTNFETIKIFNAEIKVIDSDYSQSRFLEIKYSELLERFDDLWLLSKESFLRGELDKVAEKVGKAKKRIPIDKQLLEDFTLFRTMLSKNIAVLNKHRKLTQDDLDEAVQMILDRLIFIRYCEDKELEEKQLMSMVRASRGKRNLAKGLLQLFAYYDHYYDSKIFDSKYLCNTLDVSSEVLEDIINGLHETKDHARYNFADIEADVLGNIYEQYLGHILKKTQRTATVKQSLTHRKKQGIYYTPTYVVEYIVKNTLGRLLEDKTINPDNVKVLDLACGSGSFLTKSLDVLNNYYEWHDKAYYESLSPDKVEDEKYKKRLMTLTKHIFGVDLDKQAVEIAQLNLFLKVAKKAKRLPRLHENIRQGNSIIDSSLLEEDRPFHWEKEFAEIMEEGGFDVIVGNPPYLKEMDNKEGFQAVKTSAFKQYYQGKMDIWYFFLHRAIDVAKPGGYIGFITNSYWTKGAGASKLIQRIKDNLVLLKVVDFGDIKVFEDVNGKHMIHIYQKRKAAPDDRTEYIKLDEKRFNRVIVEEKKITKGYANVITDDLKLNFASDDMIDFRNTVPLGTQYDVSQGVVEATDKVSKKASLNAKGSFVAGEGVFVLSGRELESLELDRNEMQIMKKYLDTNDVGKYSLRFNEKYLIYSDKEAKERIKRKELPRLKAHLDRTKQFITSSNKPYGLHRPRESRFFNSPKLICKSMFSTPEFCFDDEKYYVGFSFSVIIAKSSDFQLKYLLAVLNSTLGNYWFNRVGKKRGVGVDIGVEVFRQFPVYKAQYEEQEEVSSLVDKALELNKRLADMGDKVTDSRMAIEFQIKKIEAEIDELIYKTYKLTEEEINIIKQGAS